MQPQNLVTILDAKAATGIGTPQDVSHFRFVTVELGTADSANLTVKAVGSISEACPDFSAAQSVANNYDFLSMIDLEDASGVDGDDGIVCAGTDDFRLLTINVNGIKWLNFRVTARSAGSVTVKIKAFQA